PCSRSSGVMISTIGLHLPRFAPDPPPPALCRVLEGKQPFVSWKIGIAELFLELVARHVEREQLAQIGDHLLVAIDDLVADVEVNSLDRRLDSLGHAQRNSGPIAVLRVVENLADG